MRPLQRSRSGDCRRRRGDAAGADRGVPATHHAGPQARDSSSAARSCAEAPPATREQALEQAAWGWDASPISTARLSAELWNQIKDEDWSLVSDATFISNWPLRLWDFTKHYQFIGWSGAYGIGYGAPAAVGAALANRKHGRLSVNIQCDGDLNYAPGRAVDGGASPHPAAHGHAQQPRLSSGADVRHRHGRARRTATSAARGIGNDARRSGHRLRDAGQGVRRATASGRSTTRPISARRSKRAIEVVKRGEPALVDVVTQPR